MSTILESPVIDMTKKLSGKKIIPSSNGHSDMGELEIQFEPDFPLGPDLDDRFPFSEQVEDGTDPDTVATQNIFPSIEQFPTSVIVALTKGRVTKERAALLQMIADTDFSRDIWDVENEWHVESAAHYLAVGGRVLHPFGNILALTGHPDTPAVVHSNRTKGRPDSQVGSVTTTTEHFSEVFDRKLLPQQLRGDRFIEILNALYGEIGPFGVRGPASQAIVKNYPQLQTWAHEMSSTQLIAVGDENDPTHKLLRRAAKIREELGESPDLSWIWFITSANVSSKATGKEEPAHWLSRQAKESLGSRRIPILGYSMSDQEIVDTIIRGKYGRLEPKSTTVISLHYLIEDQEGIRRPTVMLERKGSAPVSLVKDILDNFGLGLSVTGNEPLQTRKYPGIEFEPQK